jgi:two-component system OmpR family sensor kinase
LPIKNEDISIFNVRVYNGILPKKKDILFQKGNKTKGFKVIKFKDKNIIYIYNPISKIYLQDMQTQDSMILIHTIFVILLIIQTLLFIRLQKLLNPLSKLQKKLKELQSGNLSLLDLNSNYDEIKQIIASYNTSISKIEYILEMREMFNKIFMHEIKMPIAKAMFYLKQKPSFYVHEKLNELLHRLNDELDEFSIIESLIVYQNNIKLIPHNSLDIINEAIKKIGIEHKNIVIKGCDSCKIIGDKELWILCFKNLIDNALKYANDHKLIIKCSINSISFINKGDELPVDLSKDIKKWKIDKNKRHKSSTGYGFGLFIIKNIVTLNGYDLKYIYKENCVELKIERIKG